MIKKLNQIERIFVAKVDGRILFEIRHYLSPKGNAYFFMSPTEEPRIGDYKDVVRAGYKRLQTSVIPGQKVDFVAVADGEHIKSSLAEFQGRSMVSHR